METKWTIRERKSKLTNYDIPIDNNILNILSSRGITTKKDVVNFITPKLENLENPLKLKDIDIAILYIKDAIKKNLKICIYGDYDVDGITSTSLLYLSFKKLYDNIMYRIPLRDDGYGLNNKIIDELKAQGVDLIITVDCGITAYTEVEHINKLGMKVIITDHHDLPSYALPKALACINPKRLDSEYSFPNLAGVGVAFMLAYSLFKTLGRENEILEYIDLVALGTIADVMPIIKDNRIITKFGLEKMKNSNLVGIRKIIEKLDLSNKELTTGDVSFKIAPIFNAVGRLSEAKLAVTLLTSENIHEINYLVDNLISNNIDRKGMQNKIIETVTDMFAKQDISDKKILIAHSPDFHHGIIGIVAARIVETYYKPAIIMEENVEEGVAVGSCRSVEGFNISKALSAVSHLLTKFGGHANAAGFTVPLKNLEEFKIQIEEYAKKELEGVTLYKNINIDMSVPAQKVSYEFVQVLNLLKPFGFGNPTPVLITKNCIISNLHTIGANGAHLKFDVDQKGFSIKNVTWFNKGNLITELNKESIFYDIVFKIDVNEFNDRFYPNVLVEDMKPSSLEDDKLLYFNSLFNTSFPIKSVFYTTVDLKMEDELKLKESFESYSIYKGSMPISKLDKNFSTLLSHIHRFYNYEFEIKIEKIDKRERHNIVHVLIKRKYYIESYAINDKVIFNNIKKFLLPDFDYNSVTKEVLSKIYKEDLSVNISLDNISIKLEGKDVKIPPSYFNQILYNVGLKYYLDNDGKKMTFYTKNKYFLGNPQLKAYFNFENKILVSDKNDMCIYDFSSLEIPHFNLRYEKAIFFEYNNYTNKKIYDIKKVIVLPANITKFKKTFIKNLTPNNGFFEFLPAEKKKELLNNLGNNEILYSDESIINYY